MDAANTIPAIGAKIALAIGNAPVDAIVQSETLRLSLRFRATPTPVTLELVCDPRVPHKLVDWRRYD